MKRKPIVLILMALLALVVALPPAPAATAASDSEDAVYLALGDSLAEGWGNEVLEKYPYVPRFFDFLEAGHHSNVGSLTNLGTGGETSASFITNQLSPALAVMADPDTDVSVVTLDIGGNDLLDLMRGPCIDPNDPNCVPAAVQAIWQFAGNYAYILGALGTGMAAEPGDEAFIVMTYYNPWSGTGSPYEGVVEFLLHGMDQTVDCTNFSLPPDPNYVPLFGMNDVLACTPGVVGMGSQVAIADVYPRFVGKGAELTYVNYNNIHPNNAGYTQIANVFKYTYLGK